MDLSQIKKEIEADNRRLKSEYGSLFEKVSALLFRHDPVGINFEINSDEYEPEVRRILPGLRGCTSVEDVLSLIHEVFQQMFDADTAGPRERYVPIANELWMLSAS